MKMSLVSLGSVLFLAACSGGGGSGDGGGVNPMGGPVNPAQRPLNPASKAYIKQFFAQARKFQALVPTDSAIFPETFGGEYISTVSEDSRNKSIALLNDQGLQFLERIKTNCTISPVSKVASGETEKAQAGDVVTVKMELSSAGSGCEFLSSQKADIKTHIIEKSQDLDGGTSTEKIVKEENESETREVRNSQIIAAGGYRSDKNTRTSRSESEYRFERVPGPEYKYKQYSKYTRGASGTSETVLSNGAVVNSTNQSFSLSERSVDENRKEVESSESSSLMKMTTPGGAVWLGYSRKNNEAEIRYLNGEEISDQEASELFGNW